MLRALLGFSRGMCFCFGHLKDSHCYELYGGCKAIKLSEESPLGKLKVLRWRLISMTPSLYVWMSHCSSEQKTAMLEYVLLESSI